MAASMCVRSCMFLRLKDKILQLPRCTNCQVGQTIQTSTCVRYLSSDSSDDKSNFTLSKDGTTILCFHPEQEFPYEHTTPIPWDEPEFKESDSTLKVQYLLEEKYKNRPDGPLDWELVKMFSTYKYEFRPRPAKKYRKPNPPQNPRKSFP